MLNRAAFLFLVVLTIPASTQQTGIQQQVNQRIQAREERMRPESPAELDLTAARLQSIHQDAEQLSALSATLQLNLIQLQKGMLTKDLMENLKKMEKLSKKLRQEVVQ
jgi:hypothetical protein